MDTPSGFYFYNNRLNDRTLTCICGSACIYVSYRGKDKQTHIS